ncbi:uncharacterized protein LOC110985968 [Acanthaster planci]|uniref:Uncharacterized protein LOC110985968 n=1 Tax=Acanthaster planci TaxID=133434 RepID=A0A8B7ZBZ8_ACAPL|nr:uncharacterized protein LOC110985968 [Acanthaster planci]
MKCCGPRPYEPSDDTQLCCAGRLFPIEGERILCTDGIVHSLQETVCEGVRYGVANGECCGKVLMDDTKTCCQGFVYSKEEHGTECCGRVAYDPSAQPQPLCCEDSLYPSAPGLQCCGNQAIDPTERQCCGAEGHRFAFLRNSGHTCCGQTAGDYDPSQHTCCQGLLHKFVQNGDCCGNDVVRNSSKEICCGGIVQVKSFENDTVCCNGHILDGRRYQCCGNRSLQRRSTSQCCNGIVYDSRHQQCMEGEVQAKGAEETTVHARRIFARQTEHAQRITQDATDMADDDIEKTTDAEGQTAHVHERMIPRGSMEATLVTCDSMDYDSEVKGCCHGVLYRLANETCADGLVLGLCDGQDAYNPLTHGCCGDKVYNRSVDYCDETTTLVNPNTESSGQGNSTQTSTSTPGVPLCGGLGYDQALQGCCDDRVYNLSTEYCHNNSMVIPKFPSQPDRRQSTTVTTTIESATDDGFFLVTHEPCSVIRARENVSDDLQCCGSLLYNPLNATCCQGITNDGDTTVVAWSAVTEGVVAGHCCRETAYDSSTAVCCNGEVVRKEWLTPDVFNGCCPEGQSWNRFLEACEPSPTRETILTDGPSGMSPDEY